jgi:hypothetical protein
LSKFQQFIAGRATSRAAAWRPRASSRKSRRTSVEWIMVRMDLLAYYKKLFLSYYDATNFVALRRFAV